MAEDGLAVVAFQMLVEANAGECRPGQHRGQRGLAYLQGIAAQVVAVQLDQVDQVEALATIKPSRPPSLVELLLTPALASIWKSFHDKSSSTGRELFSIFECFLYGWRRVELFCVVHALPLGDDDALRRCALHHFSFAAAD